MLVPGYILQNRYRIVRQLGAGGMGAVYLAQHLGLAGKPVAVKENIGGDPHQFQTEAVMLANLNHPNLPRVIDHFIEGAAQYLVMDYIEGQNLDLMVQQYGALPESNVLTWMFQVLDAVKYLHASRVIHRDIKPQNIIVTLQGKAVLTDFGIAKVLVAGHSTSTGARAGSPGYAPPEQYVGGTTERSDIYSLGATLYYILTGHTPPESPNRAIGAPLTPPRQINRNISANTEIAILTATNLLANQRYSSVVELEQALRAIPKTIQASIPQQTQSPQHQPISFVRSSRLWQYALIGGIIVILCLCVLLANAIVGVFRPGRPTATFVPIPTQNVPPAVTVLVVSPTPRPTTPTPFTFPRVPPSSTVEPTQTPTAKPLAALTTAPTATPPTTPALARDTSLGSTLKPGETWRQQNMAMTLQNANFAVVGCGAFLEFDLSLENAESSEIVVTWRGEDLVVKDNQEKTYEVFYSPMQRLTDCAKYTPMTGVIVPGLAAKQNFKVFVQARGELNDKAGKLYVIVAKAGRIQNARWEIPVQR